MMDAFGDRQQTLLKLLLNHKQGLALDELAEKLDITRTAVRQHIATLERTGYVERGELQASGGRPRQVYRLTAKGYDIFPKQYSWFSEVLLAAVSKEKGREGLRDLMRTLGKTVAGSLDARVNGKTSEERVQATVKIMNDLAYEARASLDKPSGAATIEATNCVYHSLAASYPQVCEFDLALLEKLTGSKVIHETCIVRGGDTCRFRLEAAAKKKSPA